ncbi:MAG: alpha/beta hydrolase family protein [Anaerolineales bacterium]
MSLPSQVAPRRSGWIIACLLSWILLSTLACNGGRSALSPTATSIIKAENPGSQVTLTPSPTPSPPPTSTDTATPTRTSTATPISTATPLHPLAIEAMRQESYPGSELVIEETLPPESNYDRYVVSYQSKGLKIYAMLTVPQGEKPESGWPFIIFNHGYIPPDQYRTAERYLAYVHEFASEGYIVLAPDYRGHGNSEGEPADAHTVGDYTVDVLNAVTSVQRYPDADPQRVGMWGHSMGGALTLRAMVVSDQIDAGVIWAGVVAPVEDVWEKRPNWIVRSLKATPDGDETPEPPTEGIFAYGMFDENPTFWASVDPTFHLEKLSGPLQLHHSTADDSVPVEWSEDLYARLQDADQSAELYLYEGDDHNLSNSFVTAMGRCVQFFDRHVKGAD